MKTDIEELLTRSIAEILPSKDEFKKVLAGGKKLRFYVGTDATGPQLHLGHSTNYLLIEKFRKLGHEVIILFGDFTALIGDPTDKDAARKQQTPEEIENHIQSWKSQVEKIVDFNDPINPATILKNSTWLSKLTFENLIDVASSFTVQHMLERDMFEKRMNDGKPVYLHEFFYPLMQGYDSVAMDVDVEIGGTDQTFNMLAGRILQKKYNHKDKFVITTTLLSNPATGKKLMSKSEGVYIALDDAPNDMYGKVLALPDGVVRQMFIDTTLVSLTEIEKIINSHPKEAKMRLAREIVGLYHGEKSAEKAEENFIKTFSEKGIPDDTKTVQATFGAKLVDILLEAELIKSKTEFKTLVGERAITNAETEEKIESTDQVVDKNIILKIGKRRFLKIEIE